MNIQNNNIVIWCQLGDCNNNSCHNCFPVKLCSYNHTKCKTIGIFNEVLPDKMVINTIVCNTKTPLINTVILVTGSCGFIGFHLTKKLLLLGYTVIGIDMKDSFIYDSIYKINNSKKLKEFENYKEFNENILERNHILENNPDIVIHLAAYANVRKSILHPDIYVRNNVECTCNLLEQINRSVKKPLFIYASSSSVYGTNKQIPFKEDDVLSNIESPYALSKKTCEEYVKFYCKKYKIKAIGLRFFTVYGPGGRPDMAIFNFLNKIKNNEQIEMFGDGSMERDYTYVLDIIEGVYNCINVQLLEGEHRIYNLGNNNPIKLSKVISICERIVGKKAKILQKEIPIGDVPITYANIDKARHDLLYYPTIDIETGISEMYKWIIQSQNNININIDN